jgi:hypothetical protein
MPLMERVVEVIADRGEAARPRYRYGSGCLVVGRTVLTAAHVLTGAIEVSVRDPNKITYKAQVDSRFVGDEDARQPDLALVEISNPRVKAPPMGLAAVNRATAAGDPVGGCQAVGYPQYMKRDADGGGGTVRDTVGVYGQIPVLSHLVSGLLSLQVSNAPRPLPPQQTRLDTSEWAGMSGAPVVAGGRLIGVVTEHAPREGTSTITLTPLTALEAHPGCPGWGRGVPEPGMWWQRLGVSGIEQLPLLPHRRQQAVPAYWATVQEIHQRTGLLVGRQQELAELAAFAVGGLSYVWWVGGAWAGKTALLAEAVTSGLPENVDVVCYFLSRREAEADSNRFLAAVVPQLAMLLGEDIPEPNPHQFRMLWSQASTAAAVAGRHLLLVVDGLDEDLHPGGLPSVAALLPAMMAPNARVLVSSRPYPPLPVDVPVGHPLRTTAQIEIEPFEGSTEREELARQEIHDLIRQDHTGLASDVLGMLTVAAGPLTMADLAALTAEPAAPSPAHTRQVRRLVTEQAGRSLQPTGLAGQERFQFAHESLLTHAQENPDLRHRDYRQTLDRWAAQWRATGWPTPADGVDITPRYLLDAYPAILHDDPHRLARLVSEVGWVDASIDTVGVHTTLATLRTAQATTQTAPVTAILATVRGQAHHLTDHPTGDRGYILRQLGMQALELREHSIAAAARHRQLRLGDPGPVPQWTDRRASPTLVAELGSHDGGVRAVAVLPNGRVVTGGADGRIWVWDPQQPGTPLVDLGTLNSEVRAVAVLPNGRVVTGGADGRIWVWDPQHPGTAPVSLGCHLGRVEAVAVLPDGRVVTGGADVRVRVWDLDHPGTAPVNLGHHHSGLKAIAALSDGRVVTGGDRRVRMWDPEHPVAAPVNLGRHDAWVRVVAVLPDGRVVTGGADQRVRLWDVPTRTLCGVIACPVLAAIASVTAAGQTLLVVAHDGGLSTWVVPKRNATRRQIS